MKTPLSHKEGAWSALPLGELLRKKVIEKAQIVFQYKSNDGEILDRFAVFKCNCSKPMVEYWPTPETIDIPGANPFDSEKQAGWVIWCDECDIHAGPNLDRDITVQQWNQLVESLKVFDDL